MKIARSLLACLAAAAVALAFDGDSFAAKFDALPKAVQQTATANMEHAFPVSITSAKGEHGWNYQVNTRRDGRYHDIVIEGDGKLIALKDEIDLATMPELVKATIQQHSAGSKLVTLEKLTEAGQVSYAALILEDEQKAPVRLRIAPDGTLK